MRCSAATSVAIGSTLDVGARMMKKQAPANAAGERRQSPHAVSPTSVEIAVNGSATSRTEAGGVHK
jgi:hypothetical protein